MLGLVIRGFFLISIIGWYSQSVWRMIDGYFRDQFQKYLQTELQKYPKIRSDLKGNRAVDKAAPVVTDAAKQSVLMEDTMVDIPETYKDSVLPVDTTVGFGGGTNGESAIDKSVIQRPEEVVGSVGAASEVARSVVSVPHSVGTSDEDTQRKQSNKRKWKKIAEEEMALKLKKKKKKVKLVKFSDDDFKSTNLWRDYDFSQFESDDVDFDEVEPEDGVLVSMLPFKPKLDLGKLQRISEDEFCPFTPDEEPTCSETKKWP